MTALYCKKLKRMADFDDQLEKWFDSIENSLNLSLEEQSEITGAGAKVYQKVLKKNTPRSDVDYSQGGKSAGHANAKHGNKHRKTRHIADMITYKPGFEANGLHTGSTAVGWQGRYYAFVAKITNNGKKQMSSKQVKNMHFKDRSEKEAAIAVRQAIAKKYREVTGL